MVDRVTADNGQQPGGQALNLDLVLRAGESAPVPIVVRAQRRATVGDLRRAIVAALGVPGGVLGTARTPLRDTRPLLDAGLVHGAEVRLYERSWPDPGIDADGAGPLEVAVAGGLHAGSALPLPGGLTVTVGRAPRCDVSIADEEVSRRHATLTSEVDDAAVWVSDLGSRNGIRHGDWRLAGEHRLRAPEVIGLGESVLAVRAPLALDADVTTVAHAGERLVNRPPRIRPPDRVPELVLPAKPAPPRGVRFPWLTTLLPALLFGGLYLVLPAGGYGGYLLAMTALSPLMALTNVISDRRSGRTDYARRKVAYELADRAFQAALAATASAEERRVREEYPDPARLVALTGAGGPGVAPALWQRRRADPDFLRLRIGLIDRPASVSLRPQPPAGGSQDEELPSPPTVRDVPLTVDLTAAGVLGLAGPRPAVVAAGRALLLQAAALHAPADLGIVLIAGAATARDWEWATWLPHTLPSSALFDCARMVAITTAQARARLAELRHLAGTRTGRHRERPAGRAMLVLLDGARGLRDVPGLAELLATGPAAGVYAVCLDTEETALPVECRASVVATTPTGSRARVRRPDLAAVADVLLDGLVAPAADAAARALAPLRALGAPIGESALPDQVRFTELAGLAITAEPATDAHVIAARWSRACGDHVTTALLGAGPSGPVTVDLRRDGPHAVVAGTSGAGKSELLQTLVTSLALDNSPEALTFMLVDYKGGSAFAACASLPHCVGLVTDLDGPLVARALDSLSAELRRREALLAERGAKDIDDYRAQGGPGLPRLVIVVDEFASLAEEVPDFVPGVVAIGMRGRSLGVHVVLATQRPAGVVTADLRANLNLRISLRVTAESESVDVIDAPDAAHISASQPGRAYLRTGHGELTAFQSARIGWPRPATAAADVNRPPVCVTARRLDTLGQAQRSAAADGPPADGTGRTDLSDIVAAIAHAAADLGTGDPRTPWLPPLPAQLPLATLDIPAVKPSPVAAVLGVVDRPAAQSQDAFVVDLARTGPLAVAGAVRAGRSTTLRTLAASIAVTSSPADVHLYALDCGNRALAPLRGMPHCGAVVDGDDEQRTDRLLTMLETEVARRQRRLGAHGHGSLTEQRAAVAPADRLPYLVLLLDRLEVFVARYAEADGGRQLNRVEWLLRTGPAAGIGVVLTTDRTGFGHRIASAVASRLVLRQAAPDDAAAFGVDPRLLPRRMPPGRAILADTGEQIQVALLGPEPSGAAQSAELARIGADLTARWEGIDDTRRARRVDPLPDEISVAGVTALRRRPRPSGPAVCTPAAGGDHLGPVDVDLGATGGTFLVAGPPRSGRSTALLAIVESLAGRLDGLPVLAVAPRRSPLRELAGVPGVLDVLTDDQERTATGLAQAVAAGPVAIVVDDAELIAEYPLAEALDTLARDVRDGRSALIAAVTTEDILLSRHRGWLATMRRSRCGLLLNPASAIDGEVFELRLPRSTAGGWPPGRGLLVMGGESRPVQVTHAFPVEVGT